MNWKIFSAFLVMFIFALFALQNYEQTAVKFLFWSFQTSRAIVIFITFTAGALLGWVFSYFTNKL